MELIHSEYFEREYISPMRIADQNYDRKIGVYYIFKDENNIEYKVENSPIPALHGINYQKVESELFNVLESCSNDSIEEISNYTNWLWECIRYNTLQKAKTPKSNELFIPKISNIETFKNSNSSIKVKIGRQTVKEDKETLKSLVDNLHPMARLRLDGNRSISPSSLVEILKDIPAERIEYLEEPTANIDEWENFYKELPLPLAIDESLNLINLDNKPLGLKTLVLKPTVYGGLQKSIKLIEKANHYDINVVISSTFETEVGMKYHYYLADIQNTIRPTDAGLNTLGYLK